MITTYTRTQPEYEVLTPAAVQRAVETGLGAYSVSICWEPIEQDTRGNIVGVVLTARRRQVELDPDPRWCGSLDDVCHYYGRRAPCAYHAGRLKFAEVLGHNADLITYEYAVHTVFHMVEHGPQLQNGSYFRVDLLGSEIKALNEASNAFVRIATQETNGRG